MLNKIIDHHVHTDFSPDCDTPMEDIIDRAKTLELKRLLFTDHVDFDSPVNLFKEIPDYNEYIKKLDTLRDKNKDLEIRLGVEIGYQPHIHQELNDFLDTYPFDFVICSIHSCNGLDFYNGDFFKEKSQEEAYYDYFQGVKESIDNYNNYDVFGHLDYIVRYGNFKKRELKYPLYKEILDDILKSIINKGKGIELNTSGLRYNLKVMHPNIEILKRYRELGGEIITIGSDAHRDLDLQRNFKEALEILRDLDYKAITQFKDRKPQFIDIL